MSSQGQAFRETKQQLRPAISGPKSLNAEVVLLQLRPLPRFRPGSTLSSASTALCVVILAKPLAARRRPTIRRFCESCSAGAFGDFQLLLQEIATIDS